MMHHRFAPVAIPRTFAKGRADTQRAQTAAKKAVCQRSNGAPPNASDSAFHRPHRHAAD
jgi:hypothetical protein